MEWQWRKENAGERGNKPIVFVTNQRGALCIAALNKLATQHGIKIGMTLADARALMPDIIVQETDPQADSSFLLSCASACEFFTPLVATDGLDGLILDITGCAHLFGGEHDLYEKVCRRFHRHGFTIRASIAGTPDAAHAFARFAKAQITSQGQESIIARSLPVTALDWDMTTTRALTRAGLKTLGDLAERPSQLLAARFGADVVWRLHRIMGWEDVRISPIRAVPDCIVDKYFADPLLDMAGLENALSVLCGKICLTLSERGQGGRKFEANFFRSDNQVKHIAIETAAPCRDPSTLLRLFHLKMEALADPIDPGFGFDAMRLGVMQTEIMNETQTSFDANTVQDQDTQALIDRLMARLGQERVLQSVMRDTHNPARSAGWVEITRQVAGPAYSDRETNSSPARPLTLFASPQPIEAMAEVPDGPPLRFRWRRMLHQVARAEGPERIAPEWWRASSFPNTRDYYRVEDIDGHRFWIFREGFYENTAVPRWFLHGLFA